MIKKKTLTILLAVLAALCLICVLIAGFNRHTDRMKSSSGIILSFNTEDVLEFSWQGDSSYSFVKNDEGIWEKSDDDAFPVNQDIVENLLESISAYEARFEIESPDNVADYGLKNPECSIAVVTSDNSYSLLLGGYSLMDEERYFSVGDGNAYLAAVDVLDDFNINDGDIIQYDSLPDMSDLKSFSISGDNSVNIVYIEDAGYCYSDEYCYYIKNGSSYKNISSSLAENLISEITNISLSSYADYGIDDASQLAGYGLDKPQLSVDIIFDDEDGIEQSFCISISKVDDAVYGKLEASGIIYSLSTSVYDDLIKASYDNLRPEELVLVDWSEVAKISINLDDESYVFEPADEDAVKDFRSEYKNLNEEEQTKLTDPDTVAMPWTVDEKLVDLSDLTQAVEALQISEFTNERAAKSMEISFKITMNDGASETVKLYKYDSDYCLAVIDGNSAGLISRSSAVDFIESVNSLVL